MKVLKRIIMKISSLVVGWGIIFFYFDRLLQETNKFPKGNFEVVKWSLIVTIGIVLLMGLKFTLWIVSRESEKEEIKKVAKEKKIDMGVIKNVPIDR